jgi:hypothetical protein
MTKYLLIPAAILAAITIASMVSATIELFTSPINAALNK